MGYPAFSLTFGVPEPEVLMRMSVDGARGSAQHLRVDIGGGACLRYDYDLGVVFPMGVADQILDACEIALDFT